MLRALGSLCVAALCLALALVCAVHRAEAQTRRLPAVLTLGDPGVATPQPDVLSIAAPLANLGSRALADVTIDRVQLAAATVETKLPIPVGAIGARSSVIVQADFDSKSLVSGRRYAFVVQGAYRADKGAAHRFTVRASVVIPPRSEGSGQVRPIQVPPHKVEGGRYPPQKPRMDDDVNSGAPPVPTNPDAPGGPTPSNTDVRPVPR